MGGRLDATNVLVPHVSVITALSFDHTFQLGGTLEAIAAEKAGIIKPGVPVVVHPQPPEAMAVVERVAREAASPLLVVGREVLYAWQPAERWEFSSYSSASYRLSTEAARMCSGWRRMPRRPRRRSMRKRA